MIDIEKMVATLNIPDGMTVDEMRKVVVDVLDMARASNDEENTITAENANLKSENDRLTKQNLDLFNRVTTSISPMTKSKDDDEYKEEVTTEDILNYYN
jgi:hypothetical protein|nr:MAG TPA: hypothetical protein [Caudoviricetes sp.]